MAKKELKAKVKALKAKLKAVATAVETPVVEAVAEIAAKVKKAKPISPLAPAAFPNLPLIAGVEFAAVEAGIKYQSRKDVMLVRLAPGTAMAGVFTRSTTRSACVRDCQAKLALKVPADAGAAIVVNSGNSNAFTGRVGDEAVAVVTQGVADALGKAIDSTAVSLRYLGRQGTAETA